MDVINGPVHLYKKYQAISIALGTFDGVHVGHRKIIERVVETARTRNGTSVVFTFEPHPRAVLKPDRPLPTITTDEEKRAIMASLGVDVLFTLPFDNEVAKLSPVDFVCDILVKLVRPGLIVVGPNYTFGHLGKGTPELLQKLGEKFGIGVEIEPPVFVDGQMVSSTLIRKLINRGEITKANELLQRCFALSGEVVYGDGRGRGLGFPTANVALLPTTLMPADGAYAVKVLVGTRQYLGVANIGHNPTFKVNQRRLEVHILDFNAPLYGQTITVNFVQRIRDERVFAHVNELISQIDQDIVFARNILTSYE